MNKTLTAGILGCGNISEIYLKNCQALPHLALLACADIHPERAAAKAAQFDIQPLSIPELLADPAIEIIINLTPPTAHATINLAALEAGKHVYTEKPLAVNRQDGQRTLELARERGLRVGSAPDTFLGAGLQTCRKLLDEGAIGVPVAATAFMSGHGPEAWHPNPRFFYKQGAGPLFDVGPYYLTALVSLLGPVARVTGSARASFPERRITSEAHYGEVIQVEVPTHVAGVLDFANGVIGTLITSFDIWAANLPYIEIYGSEGTLSVPDPNTFGGPVRLWQHDGGWRDIPLIRGYSENSRGLGAADMAQGIYEGLPHRANGDLAYHVLDVMHTLLEASSAGRRLTPESSCTRPEPLEIA
ncbi:MAG: Gfo/Idh/MocA family oxidoreductase [Anaerolineae bacterium]|jgi:predicted dehydrogenase|nr:Gfo/Idh/MocA family oxidoreductase [Anaerolineae bacterium]